MQELIQVNLDKFISIAGKYEEEIEVIENKEEQEYYFIFDKYVYVTTCPFEVFDAIIEAKANCLKKKLKG